MLYIKCSARRRRWSFPRCGIPDAQVGTQTRPGTPEWRHTNLVYIYTSHMHLCIVILLYHYYYHYYCYKYNIHNVYSFICVSMDEWPRYKWERIAAHWINGRSFEEKRWPSTTMTGGRRTHSNTHEHYHVETHESHLLRRIYLYKHYSIIITIIIIYYILYNLFCLTQYFHIKQTINTNTTMIWIWALWWALCELFACVSKNQHNNSLIKLIRWYSRNSAGANDFFSIILFFFLSPLLLRSSFSATAPCSLVHNWPPHR